MVSLDQVREFARNAHAHQVDKLGRDYFSAHLEPVASLLEEHGELAIMAGLLHDVLEDTETTAEDLLALGVPGEVVDAVVSVTRGSGETYEELIERAARHPLGRLVKLADNSHNLAENEALLGVDPTSAVRLKRRYLAARARLLQPE